MGMKHGRPDRAWIKHTAEVYGGTHAGAWRGDLMEWRRQHAQCVWQAMQALVFGASMYEVGFDDGEVDRKPKYRPVNRWAGQ